MKKIKWYCDKQKKIILKIIKRMFGYDYISAVEDASKICAGIESEFGKNIDEITWSEIKTSPTAPKKYAKYKTLRTLIEVYINIQKIYVFSNDYEGVINE